MGESLSDSNDSQIGCANNIPLNGVITFQMLEKYMYMYWEGVDHYVGMTSLKY